MSLLSQFLSGAYMMSCIAVAMFFFRYWRTARERLFAILAIAFLLLAFERAVLAFSPPELEGRHFVFLARLTAFLVIIAGIVDKNRAGGRSGGA
jgi:hypothetical protein